MKRLALLLAFLVLYAFRPAPPLIVAARSGDGPQIRALVREGADPNAIWMSATEWTPLLHAVHKDQLSAVAALLDVGADPNRADSAGMTPLMFAAGYGQTGMVRLLLQHGADPRLRDRHGDSALDYALTGTTDIDRFTWFACQDATVHAITSAAPRLEASSGARTWARLKGCATR